MTPLELPVKEVRRIMDAVKFRIRLVIHELEKEESYGVLNSEIVNAD